MSTITPHNIAADRTRVRSPLERLRGTIRRYVCLEGLGFVGMFLALWFWIGLAFDYGFFRLFDIDWVQELPRGFRVGVLIAVAGALAFLLARQLASRLFREFSDPVLAYVLERRYPHILGDRLITAVELSDLDKAAQQGYSVAMVEETIHEAAERVDKLPIHEVFVWKRLWRRAGLVLALTLGLYLVVGGLFAATDQLSEGYTDLGGYDGLNRASIIWFERNVLLRNLIWPRKAYLELIGFPESGEIRIGKDTSAPAIRVRAFKYVVAGRPSRRAVEAYRDWLLGKGESVTAADETVRSFARPPAEGWRPLTWFDLDAKLFGQPLPIDVLPTDWMPRVRERGLTVDEIELKLDIAATHETLAPEAHSAFRDLLEHLDQRVAQPGMWRRLRKLAIPPTVYLHYWGLVTSSRSTLDQGGDNEYTGQFGDLKESVAFTVQGEDYYTAKRYVTVVPPPALVSLAREEERPAYLFYRPGAGTKAVELRGQKQSFEESAVSLFGGDTSRIDVPAGTSVTLIGRTDKELQGVRILPRKGGAEVKAAAPELLDAQTFSAIFPDVRQETGFVFEFTDTDGVVGLRQVVIRPADDQPPEADVQPEVVRKTRDGYMVTPLARIPFSGKVRDDNGLSEVRYAYTIGRLDSATLAGGPRDVFGLIPLIAGSQTRLLAAAAYASVARETAKLSETQYLPLARFAAELRDRPDEALPLTAVRERLPAKQKLPYRSLLKDFDLKPDEWFNAHSDPVGSDFPLWTAKLKAVDERTTQPRYRLQLWVEAIDTDLDSEKNKDGTPRPHLSPSKEKFTFVVVSETELLAEIAKEEEQLHVKLEDVLNKLLETEAKLVQVTLDLSATTVQMTNLGPMSARCEEIDQVLEKSLASTKDVLTDYQRILKELKTNVVDQKMIDRVDKTIVRPLADIESFEFPRAHDGIVNFKKALDASELQLTPRVAAARVAGTQAKEQLRKLIASLNNVMGAMQGLTDINKLITMLRKIEEEEQKQYDLINQIKKKLEDDLLKGILEPGKK